MGTRMDLVGRAMQSLSSDPRRLQRYMNRGLWKKVRYFISPPSHGDWNRQDDGWAERQYSSYEEYVLHQQSKLGIFDLQSYNDELRELVAHRVRDLDLGAAPVLCLGARSGGEVRAFLDSGAFAIGIDLNPGENNIYVLPGDFHSTIFPDGSVAVVFTNSLDHAADLDRLLRETHRVLGRGGTFIVEATEGADAFDEWAAVTWPSLEALQADIVASGLFAAEAYTEIEKPWPGAHMRFRPLSGDEATTRNHRAMDA